MILKGSQRGGGLQLARHLLNVDDNEHVTIHEVSGFSTENLAEAMREAHALSKGTKCRQFLFSLSLSPPETETVPVEVFEKAIAEVEAKMGLTGQPRAVVFHEKEGRRHAHCVWSRIDTQVMKAVHLPFFKTKLRDLSRDLYLEHGWTMPRGLMNSKARDPLNFSLAQWQQAKRAGRSAREIKTLFQDCWAISDTRAAFANALAERGFTLARGRRGHVAVDWRGEVFAVSRWVDVRAKTVRAKLGSPDDLPTVNAVRHQFSKRFTDKLRAFVNTAECQHAKALQRLNDKRQALVAFQRQERAALTGAQAVRRREETIARAARIPSGLKGLWFKVTGKYRRTVKDNEAEARRADRRDTAEMQTLIDRQLADRQTLQNAIRQVRHHDLITRKRLDRDMAEYLALSRAEQDGALAGRSLGNHSRARRVSYPPTLNRRRL